MFTYHNSHLTTSLPHPLTPHSVLRQLRALVSMNESLRQQETQFKTHCKEEKARLETAIARLQGSAVEGDSEEQVYM